MLNNNIRLIIVIIVTLALSSCATKEKLVAKKTPWMNKGIVEYTQQFGKPNSVVSNSKDEEIYVYVVASVNHAARAQALTRSGKMRALANDNNKNIDSSTQPGSVKCTTWVSFNKETKIITNISFRGSSCKSR